MNTPSGVSILLGTGNKLYPFKPGTRITLPYAGCLVTGDLNGDGIPDLLVPSNGTVVAFLGNGDGTFTQKSVTSTPTGGYLALGDFNHDGKLDFATSGNLIALGNGDGTFQTPANIVANVPVGGFTNIAAGNLTGSGWTDLVLTNFLDSYIYVLLNNQQGSFTQNVIHATYDGTGVGPTQVFLVDLTGSGNVDLVVAEGYIGGAVVYFGNGKGSFKFGEQMFPAVDTSATSSVIAVQDVNGDGVPDLIMTQGGGGSTLGVFLGKGGGEFQSPFYIGAGPSPGDLVLENLHGQATGFTDIVAPDVTGGVMVLINNTK